MVVASVRAIWRRLRPMKAQRPVEAEPKTQEHGGLCARFWRKANKAYCAARSRAKWARRRVEALYAAIKSGLFILLHPVSRPVAQISTLCFIGLCRDEFSPLDIVGLRLPDTRAP